VREVASRLAAVTHLLLSYGLVLLFVLVAIEGAGVPLPGETTLVTAAILASRGHYSLLAVIAVATVAAIVGDNTGYWIGRKGGRALLQKTPVVRDHFERLLPRAEAFFLRHGAKTVFIARFVLVLRTTAGWAAGISRMPWWRFVIFDAAGATLWVTTVAVIAYEFGRAAADAIGRYGLFAAIGIAVAAAIAFAIFKISRRRDISGR
jgi:membrane protein DedA with SNARE-associated domain